MSGAPAVDTALGKSRDRALEVEIIGCLLRWAADLLPACERASLEPADFGSADTRATYRAIQALAGDGQPISLPTVVGYLRQHPKLGGAVAVPDVARWPDAVAKLDAAGVAALVGRLKRLRAVRGLLGTIDEVTRALHADPDALDTVAERLRAAVEAKPLAGEDRLLSEADLLALPMVPTLVDGRWTVPAEGFAVGFAPPGLYKSIWALGLSLSVTTETAIFGAAVQRSGPALIIAGEGKAGLGARVKAWRAAHPSAPVGAGLWVWPEAVNLLDAGAVAELVAVVRLLQPAIVVVDTLSRCLPGGDENLQSDMTRFVDACGAVQRASEGLVLALHHTRADGGRERGSTVIRGAADAMVEFVADDDRVRLRCSKLKDGAPFADLVLVPRLVEGSVVLDLADGFTRSGDLSGHAKTLLSVLVESFGARGASAAEWLAAVERLVPRSQYYRARKALIEAELVIEQRGRFRPAADVYLGGGDA